MFICVHLWLLFFPAGLPGVSIAVGAGDVYAIDAMAWMPTVAVAMDRARLVRGGCVLFCILFLTNLAIAQTPPESATTFQRGAPATATDQTSQAKPSGSTVGPTFTRLVLALAIVLGVIFAARWVSRRLMAPPGSARSSRAIQVVSRSMIAPKQHLLLVQIGKRLVLVGNSGTSMSPLCEIRDEVEVSQVLAQVQAEKSESISKAFSSLFRREEQKYDEPEADPIDSGEVTPPGEQPLSPELDRDLDPDGPLATTKQELHELLDKVRGLSKQFDRNGQK